MGSEGAVKKGEAQNKWVLQGYIYQSLEFFQDVLCPLYLRCAFWLWQRGTVWAMYWITLNSNMWQLLNCVIIELLMRRTQGKGCKALYFPRRVKSTFYSKAGWWHFDYHWLYLSAIWRLLTTITARCNTLSKVLSQVHSYNPTPFLLL